MRTGVLFESTIARATLTPRHTGGVFSNQFFIEALGNSQPLDDETVDGVLNATVELLDQNVRFATTWDLKNCAIPSARLVFRVTRWALFQKRRLERANTRLAVVLPSSRQTLLAVVNTVLQTFGPKCPVLVTGDADDAARFMNDAESCATGHVSTTAR